MYGQLYKYKTLLISLPLRKQTILAMQCQPHKKRQALSEKVRSSQHWTWTIGDSEWKYEGAYSNIHTLLRTINTRCLICKCVLTKN